MSWLSDLFAAIADAFWRSKPPAVRPYYTGCGGLYFGASA